MHKLTHENHAGKRDTEDRLGAEVRCVRLWVQSLSGVWCVRLWVQMWCVWCVWCGVRGCVDWCGVEAFRADDTWAPLWGPSCITHLCYYTLDLGTDVGVLGCVYGCVWGKRG